MSLLARLTAPLHRPPFAAPITEALEAEFAALPAARRRQAIRKLWQREGLLRWTGQAGRRLERVPPDARRILWVTTWTTVGDAVLDLAARSLVPDGIELDLCIAPALAPLFTHDARFRRVHTDPAACTGRYDFLLLDVLSTRSIRLKAWQFGGPPFATLRGHLLGERFDRAAFADRRIRQLFGLPPGVVVAPWLTPLPRDWTLTPTLPPPAPASAFRIAVALGARVDAKRYRHWPAALERLVALWPTDRPRPQFLLIGQGPSAQEDLAAFEPRFLDRHAVVAVDAGTLHDAAVAIAASKAFLGVDGGLMHVAAALGVPGLAVFAGVEPAWFLRPDGPVRAWRVEALEAVEPEPLARRFLEVVAPGRDPPPLG